MMAGRPVVFSLFREQSVFMTAVMGFMTFLAVMALGISISIGTGVLRWNRQWDLFATVQVTGDDNFNAVKKILGENNSGVANVREIERDEMARLMAPWIRGGNSALEKYLPRVVEVEFKSPDAMEPIRNTITKHGRFISHGSALRPTISAGWKLVAILTLVLGLIVGTIGMCISFIAKNTAVLHRRELEILNQIGASDSFVVRQMQIIVAKICVVACGIGFVAAVPVLGIILAVAHSARVGLMAMMAVPGAGWIVLGLVPIAILVFAIYITRRATRKVLNQQ